MINKPRGYDDVEVYNKAPRLPIGGYVIKVKGVKKEEFGEGDYKKEVIVLAFDITEGEYAGFYQQNFEAQQTEDKKWKGTIRLYVPGDNAEEWQIRSFKSAITAIENSNPDFYWTWEEQTLKGLTCGALFRNKEWRSNDGKSGWYTECFMLISADDARNGNFSMPKDKPLNTNGGFAPANTEDNGIQYGGELADDDIPF